MNSDSFKCVCVLYIRVTGSARKCDTCKINFYVVFHLNNSEFFNIAILTNFNQGQKIFAHIFRIGLGLSLLATSDFV